MTQGRMGEDFKTRNAEPTVPTTIHGKNAQRTRITRAIKGEKQVKVGPGVSMTPLNVGGLPTNLLAQLQQLQHGGAYIRGGLDSEEPETIKALRPARPEIYLAARKAEIDTDFLQCR